MSHPADHPPADRGRIVFRAIPGIQGGHQWRTGEYIEYEVHGGHFAKRYFAEVQPQLWAELSPYGKLTALAIEVPISTTVYKPHFWSPRTMDSSKPRNQHGDQLLLISSLLFSELNMSQMPGYNGPRLPREKALDIYRRRIAIWNSSFPELATPADIDKVRAENAMLFPASVH